MIRHITSFLLVFLVMVNICSITILKLAYQANKSYFTNNFCVNKNKPQLKCEGKCHLKKTIKEITNQQKNGKENYNFNFSLEYVPLIENITALHKQFTINEFNELPATNYLYHFSISLLKPPSV